ncbi:hypothetical protein [Asanoa iriomotensis]|uniref:Ribosomally synthesized peptide with SipW-like signal peptide n=1 Tax=Asanoa iriomotensis TaxID=234613 RepID=A0ABQ4C4S9_9ACTN|nr:hypothetical protein [Asanoa iriomotensis]GIF57295.1 hypothetical protein Air01nite_33900 [Asanoa iriomotensis]
MQKRSKRILAATLAAAGVLAVSGIAYAVYSTQKTSSAVAAESNAIVELVVTGVPTDTTLWPNQATDVTLTVKNSNDTQLKITKVEPVALTDDDITNIANASRETCRGFLQLTGASGLSDAVPAGTSASPAETDVILPGAIKLLNTATNECQAMKFNTKWKVYAETNYSE